MVSRIQCNKLQFRDTLLVETNQDELKDRVGDFYTSCSNLTIALANYGYPCNEENIDDADSKSVDTANSPSNIDIAKSTKHNCIPTENIDNDAMRAVNSEDQEDEQMTAEVWRPPTPPKVSPVQKEAKHSLVPNDTYNIASEQINMPLEQSVSKTPSPPQLISVDISSWQNKDICIENTDTNEISNCKLSSPHSESASTAERNLDTTFDMSDITANPKIVSTIGDAETKVLEDCECQNIDHGRHYIPESDYLLENENIPPMPECDSLSINDYTVVLGEPSQIQLFENLLSAKDNQQLGFDYTKEKLMLSEDTTPIVDEIAVVTKEPNDISRQQIFHKGSSVILNSSLENVVVNDENTISTNNTISKAEKSSRRGTFTLGKVKLQNNSPSPNIAIVPPNTRQALMTPVQEDKIVSLLEVEAQSQNTTSDISSSIAIQQRQKETSLNSSDVETATSIASKTPPKLDTIEVPLSASASKRTLKRTGQHNLSGVASASTSKLLKGINTYRHPLKERIPAVNIISNSKPIQPHQIKTNAPSYMAATASSSRKLNFSASTEHVLLKSNHNGVVVKQAQSTSPRNDETINDGTYKENERYKGQLHPRPKDLEW